MLNLSIQHTRRLAVRKQLLSGERLPATAEGVMQVFRALGCIQLDPISAVERTQFLVLWSRLGDYERELLHQVQFGERQLFEYWAHAASIVLAEHYPLHRNRMNRALTKGKRAQRERAWLAQNEPFREFVLAEIGRKAPVLSSDIENRALVDYEGGGWTSDQSRKSTTHLIDLLWTLGDVTVAKREGLRRYWMLLDEFLPADVPRQPLSDEEETRQSICVALSALGVARKRQIKKHFTRSSYPDYAKVFGRMVKSGEILPATAQGLGEDWFMLANDLPALEQIQAGAFDGRTVLLSPFDNLICDRDRTELLWDFRFRIEIYVPKAKRQYGYYVLPILRGERLIGRIAPRMNRKTGVLTINGLYAEPDAPKEAAGEIYAEIERLAGWLSADTIVFNPDKPRDW